MSSKVAPSAPMEQKSEGNTQAPTANVVEKEKFGADANVKPSTCTGCDRCRTMVRPLEDKVPDKKTHIIALVLFLIGLPFLIFLPYCFNWFGKPAYRCPKCGNFMEVPAPG